MKKIICFLTMFLLFFTLASCDEPTEVELLGGETMNFYVGQTGTFADGFTYFTEDSDVLEIIGNQYRTLKEGSAVVTIKEGSSKLGVYLIAVYGSKPIELTALTIVNKPTNLTVASEVKLDYTKTPADANNYEALVWSSSNEEIATIDKNGNITPLKMGEVTFTLSAINTDVKEEITLTVLPRNTIFEINYDRIVGLAGTAESVLKSNVLTDYPFNGEVTWFSENSSIVTVTQDGTTTFLKPGTTNVGIKANINNQEVTFKCEVTVLEDTGYTVIRTPLELQEIANFSGDYMLGNDIDMKEAVSEGGDLYNDGKGFMPLFENAENSFKGTFDGNGFTIYNMYINRPNDAYVAFMRYISAEEGQEGLIKRLSFVGGQINGGNYTAVFYANASGYGSVNSGLRDSYAELKVTSVGTLSALVGNNKGLVENCISNVEVDALGKVCLFALNHTGLEEGLGINNCVYIGNYAEYEYANLTNGGFVTNCSKISKDQVSSFVFNMGDNWSWTQGNLPVVKGVAHE